MASQGMGKQGNRKAKLAFFTVSSVQEARKEEGMEGGGGGVAIGAGENRLGSLFSVYSFSA